MKKFRYAGIFAALFLLQSCKEKGVLIDFGDKKDIVDTTYVTGIETPQPRNVLIEEFTGASCTNCPDGHEIVASLQNSNKDRIVAVAYHTFNGGGIFRPVKEPGEESKYDFRDSAATDIGNTIFGGLNSIPTAGIDRTMISGSRLISKTQWSSETNKRLLVDAPVNLYVTATYNTGENKVVLNVKVAYTKPVATKNALTLGVLESNLIDLQKYPDSVAHDYEHNHIFRKCLTPFYGNTVLDSIAVKQPGRVYEYNYSFSPAVNWKLENCKIIAILSNNESDNKEVLQAIEVKLK